MRGGIRRGGGGRVPDRKENSHFELDLKLLSRGVRSKRIQAESGPRMPNAMCFRRGAGPFALLEYASLPYFLSGLHPRLQGASIRNGMPNKTTLGPAPPGEGTSGEGPWPVSLETSAHGHFARRYHRRIGRRTKAPARKGPTAKIRIRSNPSSLRVRPNPQSCALSQMDPSSRACAP